MHSWGWRGITGFSSVVAPCSDLTKKGQPDVKWTTVAETVLTQLKCHLITEPILSNPDFDRPFTVQTDASERGLGAVLTQDCDGEEHLVLYNNAMPLWNAKAWPLSGPLMSCGIT